MIMTYDVACPICGRIDRSLYPEKGVTMATSKGYLDYVLEQLSGLPEIGHRAMMGEYVLYYRGRVIGGIYDDRLLLKPTMAAEKMLPDAERDIPYEGAKEMLLVDVDDREALSQLIEAMYPELPEPKKRKKSKPEMERESLL